MDPSFHKDKSKACEPFSQETCSQMFVKVLKGTLRYIAMENPQFM